MASRPYGDIVPMQRGGHRACGVNVPVEHGGHRA
jgi:hypothetical protein